MSKIAINHQHITHNLNWIRQQTAKQMIAVVKNNAYNTGLVSTATTMQCWGVDDFFVTTIAEGVRLKRALPDVNVIVMDSQDLAGLALARRWQLQLSLNSYDYYLKFREQLAGLALHININSGMNRYGISELSQLSTICQSELDIVGIYTHFALAEEDDLNEHHRQVAHFADIVKHLLTLRSFDYIHAENTATFLYHHRELDCCTHTRMGILPLGYSSIAPVNALKPTIYLTATIVDIHSVAAGGYIGYGFTPTFASNQKIAVLDIGYGDGLIRTRIDYPVKINGGDYKIFKMSMSHAFILADDQLSVGDPVEIYGDTIRIDTIKNALGLTNSYQMAALNHPYR